MGTSKLSKLDFQTRLASVCMWRLTRSLHLSPFFSSSHGRPAQMFLPFSRQQRRTAEPIKHLNSFLASAEYLTFVSVMAFYRRARLALEAFRSCTSKIVPKAAVHESASRIYQNGSSISASNPAKFSGFSAYSSSVVQRFGLGCQMGTNRIRCSPFLQGGGVKRFYYVDRRRVYHFKPRGPRRWFQNPRVVLTVVLVGSGVFITVYFGHLETVPYTKRKHFVLLSKSLERKIGDGEFQKIKSAFKGKILPAIHPESIRVRLISKDIIEALQRGLMKEQAWSDLGYASSKTDGANHEGTYETLKALSEDEEKLEKHWYKDDEIIDDNWIQKSRKKGRERGSRAETSHLEGLKWEVLVVDEPVVNAFCLPGGKIVVFMGLLDHFRTDGDIATIVGHEVGHVIARHAAEGLTKNLWFVILQLVLYQFVMPDLVNTMSTLLLRLPFSRKMEIEADYIGLLLMSSAGYDPRVAPKVYEKLGKLTGESKLRDYLSTHPSGKKRAQLLARAEVMEEALALYRESIAGRLIEGFFL